MKVQIKALTELKLVSQRRDEVNAVTVDDTPRIFLERKEKNPSTSAPLFALTTGLGGGIFPIEKKKRNQRPHFVRSFVSILRHEAGIRAVPTPPGRASMMRLRFRPQLPTPWG
jgi:hypothetical protein